MTDHPTPDRNPSGWSNVPTPNAPDSVPRYTRPTGQQSWQQRSSGDTGPATRRKRPRWPWWVGAAAALLVLGLIGSLSTPATDTTAAESTGATADRATTGTSTPTPSPTSTPTPTPTPAPGTALATLSTLTVKGKSPKTGYSRAAFGPAWPDTDGNSCDTRDDVLARDLTEVTKDGPCKVTTGMLTSPYTAVAQHFMRGETTSAEVQIDHVVPLANAWVSGASRWSDSAREVFANDPVNLFAVDAQGLLHG